MPPDALIISCEHGGHTVPPEYADLFVGHEALLTTHRGWDAGALTLAERLAEPFAAPLFAATTTRLLVDLNRSVSHRQLFSEATRPVGRAAQRRIVAQHYRPHRDAVEAAVADAIDAGKRVVHIASHSFTPSLDGVLRRADVACLYDSRSAGERQLAVQWLAALGQYRPELALRRNYPYNGQGDGLTKLLRQRHGTTAYTGIELEVNQRWVHSDPAAWVRLQQDIVRALAAALAGRAEAPVKAV